MNEKLSNTANHCPADDRIPKLGPFSSPAARKKYRDCEHHHFRGCDQRDQQVETIVIGVVNLREQEIILGTYAWRQNFRNIHPTPFVRRR